MHNLYLFRGKHWKVACKDKMNHPSKKKQNKCKTDWPLRSCNGLPLSICNPLYFTQLTNWRALIHQGTCCFYHYFCIRSNCPLRRWFGLHPNYSQTYLTFCSSQETSGQGNSISFGWLFSFQPCKCFSFAGSSLDSFCPLPLSSFLP